MNKNDLNRYSMQIVMIVFSVVVYSVGIFFGSNKVSWTLGVVFGLAIALLKLRLMEVAFSKAVAMPEAKARSYIQIHYMLRYLITGIVLLVAALQSSISLMGVFVGLFSMKVGAYSKLYFKK